MVSYGQPIICFVFVRVVDGLCNLVSYGVHMTSYVHRHYCEGLVHEDIDNAERAHLTQREAQGGPVAAPRCAVAVVVSGPNGPAPPAARSLSLCGGEGGGPSGGRALRVLRSIALTCSRPPSLYS